MRYAVLFTIVAVGLVSVGTGLIQGSAVQAEQPAAAQSPVARGEYITHYVAMCVVCHSPKDDSGRVIEGQEFEGAPIPVSSPFPKGPRWASRAPNLKSMVRGNEEAVYRLLTTGQRASGGSALMPMPPFRLSDEDARAVIAYLKSL